MKFVMLVVAIGLVLVGLLAVGFGIPIKEFSTGNVLIMTGTMGVCTGAIMFALWIVVRELSNIARLGGGVAETRGHAMVRPVLSPRAMREPAPYEDVVPSSRDQPAVSPAARPARSAPSPPWQDEAVLREYPIPGPIFPEDAAPPPPSAARPKRNSLFSSSRKERERAQSRTGEELPPCPLSSGLRAKPPAAPPAVGPDEPPPFDYDWPEAQRAKPNEIPPQHRRSRTPTAAIEANAAQARNGDPAAATVVISGVIDNMTYSLHSDGSIKAEMPEGMMRFASIDELRAYLDQRS